MVSHNFVNIDDEFQKWVLSAVNSMMLDILATTARKDYTDRRRRQADGVSKAKAQGKYKGWPEDLELHKKIQSLLVVGKSYSQIQHLLGCSRHTISKVKRREM
jgi:DNA invertase Pin-like site-specific DNA recombinase